MANSIENPLLHVALYEPLIPQNTGNIGRLTTANFLTLHLIEPLGFSIDEKRVKRAGLDYWQHADVRLHPDFNSFTTTLPNNRIFALSKFGEESYHTINFQPGDVLLFGKETTGLPDEVVNSPNVTPIRLPMRNNRVRSLNLANAVAIATYEALRQLDFPDERTFQPRPNFQNS